MKTLLAITGASVLSLAGAPAFAQAPELADHSAQDELAVRIASARQTVDFIFPNGTYARMMEGSMDRIMDSILASATAMPLAQLAEMSGSSEEEINEIGEGTLAEMLAIYDPYFQERMDLSIAAMMDQMVGMMAQAEPGMRAGLTRAFADRFTLEQLNELNAFFETPTGTLYAGDAMMIFMSPQVMEEMQAIMPSLLKQMPDMMQAMEGAAAHLPPARKYDELTPDEQAEVTRLLGPAARER